MDGKHTCITHVTQKCRHKIHSMVIVLSKIKLTYSDKFCGGAKESNGLAIFSIPKAGNTYSEESVTSLSLAECEITIPESNEFLTVIPRKQSCDQSPVLYAVQERYMQLLSFSLCMALDLRNLMGVEKSPIKRGGRISSINVI